MNDALRWLMWDVFGDEIHESERKAEKAGELQGELKGEQRVNRLITCLSQDKRFDDLTRSASDPIYQKQLMKEYGILPASVN